MIRALFARLTGGPRRGQPLFDLAVAEARRTALVRRRRGARHGEWPIRGARNDRRSDDRPAGAGRRRRRTCDRRPHRANGGDARRGASRDGPWRSDARQAGPRPRRRSRRSGGTLARPRRLGCGLGRKKSGEASTSTKDPVRMPSATANRRSGPCGNDWRRPNSTIFPKGRCHDGRVCLPASAQPDPRRRANRSCRR